MVVLLGSCWHPAWTKAARKRERHLPMATAQTAQATKGNVGALGRKLGHGLSPGQRGCRCHTCNFRQSSHHPKAKLSFIGHCIKLFNTMITPVCSWTKLVDCSMLCHYSEIIWSMYYIFYINIQCKKHND